MAKLGPMTFFLLSLVAFAGVARAEDRALAQRKSEIERISKKTPVECRRDKLGNLECESLGYAIETRSCGKGAFYAGVAESRGARLDDRVDPDVANTVANLADKQFVCVGAIAKSTIGERYYVMAVPVASVPDCRGKAICKTYGDRPVKWMEPPAGPPCRRQGETYTGACAAGWVDKSVLDEFSNGL